MSVFLCAQYVWYLELQLFASGMLWWEQLQDSRNNVSVREAVGSQCSCQHILGPATYLQGHTRAQTQMYAHIKTRRCT